MPTLEEIAELSQFSRSTVSRVINNDPHVSPETRKKVWQVIQKLNYQPNIIARSLAAGHTRILGLIVPAGIATTFEDPFFPTFIRGITSACNAHNYSLMLWLAEPEYERRMINQILRNGLLDGLILSTIHLPDEMVEALSASDMPFVLVGQHHYPVDTHYVDVENRRGAQEIVTHLLRLGYERIATITGPMDTMTARHRRQGYVDALHSRAKVPQPVMEIEGDFTENSGYYAMQRLFDQHPQAVFAANDLMAMGAIRAIREKGMQIPEDIALVGFDDVPTAANTDPPLTTVRQPSHQMGVNAAEILIDVLEHGAMYNHKVILPTELIIRQSCGAVQQYHMANHIT
ncbi:MAG: LacI family DNA-binding transcriptional regulator [Anaerolineae bacterium]|nr:LacI family DNA-binding transcriptional regulator [Anaerolineae bacterium]